MVGASVLGATALALLSASCSPRPSEAEGIIGGRYAVVYGSDDRYEVYDYPDRAWASRTAEVTVALMSPSSIDDSDPTNVVLDGPTLGADYGLCSDERFVDQIDPGWCSGTLIDADLVLTAGHCVTSAAECADTRLVFDYYMDDPRTLHTITADDVYACAEVVVQVETGTLDFAVIRLDRPVVGRTPATVRSSMSELPVGTELVLQGCPSGLPIKIDGGGAVRDSRAGRLDYFVANLDSFAGNSGSGVFDKATGELVGILVRGDTDYVTDAAAGCDRVNQCPDDGCDGEDSTYAFRALEALCAAGTPGGSSLCTCGDGMCDGAGGEDTVSCPRDCGASCGDGACNGGESPFDCVADCGSCGNDACDMGEDMTSCCRDCGCPGAQVCVAEACIDDPCAGAEEIPASGTQRIAGDTSGGRNDLSPTCASGGRARERTYTFTLTETASVEALVSGFDTVLSLRSVCADPETTLACDDDSDPPGDNGSHLESELGPGTYYLIVDGYGRRDRGPFDLEVSFRPCPDADGDGACDGDVDGGVIGDLDGGVIGDPDGGSSGSDGGGSDGGGSDGGGGGSDEGGCGCATVGSRSLGGWGWLSLLAALGVALRTSFRRSWRRRGCK